MEKLNPVKFGTDGWRAVIAEEFTFDNVRVCAQAVADYLKQTGQTEKGLVVGYDTRFASEDFASAVAEVAAANGIKVFLSTKAVPTPEVSFGTVFHKAAAAVVITASHNPARYNGFKIKSADGASAPADLIAAVETNISRVFQSGEVRRMPLGEALQQNLVELFDFDPPYSRQMAQLVELEPIRKSGLHIVVDSMYGAGSGYFRKLLEGGQARVTEINGERNPSFPGINPEPIAVNLKTLSARVKA